MADWLITHLTNPIAVVLDFLQREFYLGKLDCVFFDDKRIEIALDFGRDKIAIISDIACVQVADISVFDIENLDEILLACEQDIFKFLEFLGFLGVGDLDALRLGTDTPYLWYG